MCQTPPQLKGFRIAGRLQFSKLPLRRFAVQSTHFDAHPRPETVEVSDTSRSKLHYLNSNKLIRVENVIEYTLPDSHGRRQSLLLHLRRVNSAGNNSFGFRRDTITMDNNCVQIRTKKANNRTKLEGQNYKYNMASTSLYITSKHTWQ